MNKIGAIVVVVLLPCLCIGQFTMTGLKGMTVVPEASVVEDKTFMYGIHFNPRNHALMLYPDREGTYEIVNSLVFGFLPRTNLVLNLTQIPEASRNGIGDRSIQIVFKILNETGFRPDITMSLDAPFGINQFLASNYLLTSKSFGFLNFIVRPSLGYGVPYLYGRTPTDGGFYGEFDSANFREKEFPYLRGLFGGVRLQHASGLDLSAEYDGRGVNMGLSYSLWNHLFLQIGTLQFDAVTFGLNFSGAIR